MNYKNQFLWKISIGKKIEKIKSLTRGSSPKINSAKFGIDLGTWQTINTKTITIEIRVNLISLLLSASPITVCPLKQLPFTRLNVGPNKLKLGPFEFLEASNCTIRFFCRNFFPFSYS